MNGFVQTRCPRCGNAAWGHQGYATPCQSCGTMMPPMLQGQAPQMPMQAQMPLQGQMPLPAQQHAPQPVPQQAPMPQAPQAAGTGVSFKVGGISIPMTGGAGMMKVKIIGGIVLAIALAIGGYFVKKKLTTPKGQISYASLGVDKGKPDADALYKSLAGNATKWKKDAFFWSLNYQAVRADGTVDTSKGAEIVYVSPYASESTSKKTRADSVRKYGANANGVKPSQYGWNDPVKDLEAHPAPTCTIKQVVGLLAAQGLTGSKTVRITFDPKFADFYAWRVIGSDPKIDQLYSWDDCSLIK
jgi:hypothetical protein